MQCSCANSEITTARYQHLLKERAGGGKKTQIWDPLPELEVLKLKVSRLREGTDLMQDPGSKPQLLRPVVVFHPLCMGRYNTAIFFFPCWVVRRKASRLKTQIREKNPFWWSAIYFSLAERGKSIFNVLYLVLFLLHELLFYSSALQRGQSGGGPVLCQGGLATPGRSVERCCSSPSSVL